MALKDLKAIRVTLENRAHKESKVLRVIKETKENKDLKVTLMY